MGREVLDEVLAVERVSVSYPNNPRHVILDALRAARSDASVERTLAEPHVIALWTLDGLLWLASAAAFVGGSRALYRAATLSQHGAVTAGRVVAHEEDYDGVVPVCEYVVDGVVHRVSAGLVTSREQFPLGATVDIHYLANEPSKASFAAPSHRYSPAIGLFIVALLVGALAYGLTWLLW